MFNSEKSESKKHVDMVRFGLGRSTLAMSNLRSVNMKDLARRVSSFAPVSVSYGVHEGLRVYVCDIDGWKSVPGGFNGSLVWHKALQVRWDHGCMISCRWIKRCPVGVDT